MDHSPHAQFACRLQDAQRALDVGVHIGVWRVIGIRYHNECRQMQYHVASFRGGAYPVWVANIAGKHLEVTLNIRRASIEPTPGVEGVIENERAHIEPLANEFFSQVRIDNRPLR